MAAIPWSQFGTLNSIPLLWLLMVGLVFGFLIVFAVFGRKRLTIKQGPPHNVRDGHHKFKSRYKPLRLQSGLTAQRKPRTGSHTIILASIMICLSVGGLIVFLARPNPLANLSTILSYVDQINDSKGLGYGGQRKMALDSNGNLYFAYRKEPPGFSEDEVYVAVSKDGGHTWTPLGGGPAAIVNAPPVSSGTTQGGGTGADQRAPSVAVDSGGHVHLVWYGRDRVYNGTNERQIKYSSWNGTEWSPWVNISPVQGYAGELYWQEHPVIVVDRNDALHVLWEGADSTSSGVQQIKHSMSTDGGITWCKWENISPLESSGQSRPAAVVDRYGNLYVAWYGGVAGETGTRIKWARWDADSTAWRPVQVVAGIDGVNQKHVSMALDRSNTLHLVWDGPDDTHPNSLVKYSSMNLNLTSPAWTSWVNVASETQLNQSDPTVSIGYAGTVLVAWQEWSGTDPISAANASVVIIQIGLSSSRTQIGDTSSTNKWPVMPEDSSDGVTRLGWLSGAGPRYAICYSQALMRPT